MEDSRIVDLYWARSDSAIAETSTKYGRYCYAIAYNILANSEDADESVNDTYMGAWNSMPSNRPSVLSTFLGKITRRISINKRKSKNRDKRGGGEFELALDELSECVAASTDIERTVEMNELSKAINDFLSTLPLVERDVFICRYWLFTSLAEIEEKFGFSMSKTKSMLLRTRRKLQEYLEQEGFC